MPKFTKQLVVRFFLIAACAVVLYILSIAFFSIPVKSDTTPPPVAIKKVGGWAWSPVVGWIRQRDAIIDKNTQEKKGAFGVEYNPATGELWGWSWSSKEGWVCWGRTCQDPIVDPAKFGRQAPDINPSMKTEIRADNSVHGWIKIISRKNKGWISLSKETLGGSNKYGVMYDPVKNEFSGWAWGVSKLGWIVFSGRTLYDTKNKPPCVRGTRVCTGTDAVTGSPYETCKESCAVTEVLQSCAGKCRSGLICNEAVSEQNSGYRRCLQNSSDTDQGTSYPTGRACEPNCEKSVDTSDPANQKSKWKTSRIGAWVQAIGGAVASIGGFESLGEPPELDQYNAEFLVVSKSSNGVPASIIMKCEQAGLPAATCKNFGVISQGKRVKSGGLTFPSAKKVEITINRGGGSQKRNQLRSKGAALDVDALTDTTIVAPIANNKNKYGKKVIKLPSVQPEEALFTKLKSTLKADEDTIYFADSDLTITPQLARQWEIVAKPSGPSSRTVVVKGDLIIQDTILYEKKPVNSLKRVPSIAWVALKKDATSGGNIRIDNCIPPSETDFSKFYASISGIFFAEETISTGTGLAETCKNDSKIIAKANYFTGKSNDYKAEADALPDGAAKDAKRELQATYARWASKLTNLTLDINLVVHGLMIAKRIEFDRRYGGFDVAAEKIINDNRYLVSIPPGLNDFLKKMPASN